MINTYQINVCKILFVILIVFFNSKIQLFDFVFFKNGFIGYDILIFLISFEISKNILNEIADKKDFSFINYYKKILTSSLVVISFFISVVYIVSVKIYLPIDLLNVSKSILNFIFLNSDNYFNNQNLSILDPKILKIALFHSWFIAIIIKIYLILPLVLYLIINLISKKILINLFLLLIILFSLSVNFYLNEFFFQNYSIISKIWIMFFAISLNTIKFNNLIKKENIYIKKILLFFSLIFLFYYIFFDPINENLINQRYVLGLFSAFIIIIFLNLNFLKLIANKLNPIYIHFFIWHYPVFTFIRYFKQHNIKYINELLALILIFILSYFTFKIFNFIIIKKKSFKYSLLISLPIIVVILFQNFHTVKQNGLLDKYPDLIISSQSNLDFMKVKQSDKFCHNRIGDDDFCTFNINNNNNANLFLLGDSLTDALLYDLINKTKKINYSLTHMSYNGQLFVSDMYPFDKNKKKFLINDDKMYLSRKKKIQNKVNNSYVIIFGNYPYYLLERFISSQNSEIKIQDSNIKFLTLDNIDRKYSDRIELFKKKFKDSLYEISKKHKIILIYPIPQPPKNIRERVNNNYIQNKYNTNKIDYKNDYVNYDYIFFQNFYSEIFDFLDDIENENIYKIYPHEAFCKNDLNKCLFYDQDKIYFFDYLHPSLEGSSIINNLILNKIKKTLNN